MSCAAAAPGIAHTNIAADSVAFNQWLKIIVRLLGGRQSRTDQMSRSLTGRHCQHTTPQRGFSSLHWARKADAFFVHWMTEISGERGTL
jgi:hypothetical protein